MSACELVQPEVRRQTDTCGGKESKAHENPHAVQEFSKDGDTD